MNTMSAPPNEPLTAAMGYAAHGWPVIPLHTAHAGKCSCGKPDCSSPGKHPRTPNGLKDASTDPETLASWWQCWPDANVAVLTGNPAGIVAIDIDPRHGGDKSLAELIRQHGKLPQTVEALTGGGGRHLIFARPGDKLGNRANIRPGIDVRGDGGYIVAAPSGHVSGGAYSWRPGHAPDELQFAPMPNWLLELATKRRNGGQQQPTTERPVSHNGDELARLMDDSGRYVAQAEGAAEGRRNDAAFNLAGHLAAFETDGGLRLTEQQIVDLLRPWNHRNAPPLAERELRAAVHSAMTNGTPRAAHVVHIPIPTAMRPPQQEGIRPDMPKPKAPAEPFRRFPVDVLPEPVRSFVRKAADTIGCDPSFVALPLLSALASAIGNTHRIQLKRGWTEPCILWTVIVGESGALKSPAIERALRPIRKRQARAMRRNAAAMEEYAVELARYERAVAEWKRNKSNTDPPAKPMEPVPDRCYCDDVTIEAMSALLVNQPRGLLLACDELAGWLGGFDRYVQGKGGDVAKWLEMFGGRPVVVDRKSGNPRTIYIPQAAVSIAGGIQPKTLRRALGVEHRENGLLARLLLAMPPARQKRWTEAEIDEATEALIEQVFDWLYELQPDTDDEGKPRPRLVQMTPKGRKAWIAFYDAHAAELAALSGDLSAAWSKLEGYTARLALVVHCVRWVAGDTTLQSPDAVDEVSIAAGVELSRWFGHEARRVYATLGESDEGRDRRHLVEWIERRGGRVSVRELTHGLRPYRGQS
ncbi:MAG: DUF3987 domain-containing protein, partial [Phycisphaerae bacterium]|nr:DUF3987 domain-containing protein [Phycisphaerae bacterium]